MKARLKTAIKRTRAKLDRARSDAKSGRPGTKERVTHHSQVLSKLTSAPATPATPAKGR